MTTRNVILVIVLLSFCSAAVSQQPAHIPRREDIVAVVYKFTLTPDGKAHDIKVSWAFWQKDHSNASGVLTDAEKARGASPIATHRYQPRPDQVCKKRYDFVLLDTKSRQFNWGTRR
jgi:hypothetical protein